MFWYFDPSPDQQEIKQDDDRIAQQAAYWLFEYVVRKDIYDKIINSPINLNVSA